MSALKEKIEEEHKLPAEQLKLIVKGKVMDDPDQTIKDHKIEEGGFIVCMVTKVSIKFKDRFIYSKLWFPGKASCC